jgi:predicted ABC-class ATPase
MSYGGKGGYGKGGGGGKGGGKGGGGGRGNPGKGEYYKNLYGGGGKGRGRGGGGEGGDSGPSFDEDVSGKRSRSTLDSLRATLLRIDGKPYPAYRDVEQTEFDMGRFSVVVQKVQADPFAPPSRCYVRIPLQQAGFPPHCFAPPIREVALRDWLTRRFAAAARKAGVDQRAGEGGWHGPKGGDLLVDLPGQHVLDRSSVVIDRSNPSAPCLEARFTVALPARGRNILGEWASEIFASTIPALVHEALYFASCDKALLDAHLLSVEDQEAARAQLRARGLVAFVADGSLLPRRSGASDLPMDAASAVPFASPPSLRVTLTVPNKGQVAGMGVPRGVTLIVGGGFHGKSTLLEALQVGVYNKVVGDGREGVVTDSDAVKVGGARPHGRRRTRGSAQARPRPPRDAGRCTPAWAVWPESPRDRTCSGGGVRPSVCPGFEV